MVKGPSKIMETAAFDRIRPAVGLVVGLLVLYGAMFGTYFFWRNLEERNLENTGNILYAGLGVVLLVTFAYIGSRIIISTIARTKDVIPAQDRKLLEPLIASSNERAIEQYVRLSSLSGATGTATRLGLTGLPLLTVALTLIFSGLELYKPTGGFMDLAKLTLGAFIGSFVQRTATSQAVETQVRRRLYSSPNVDEPSPESS